MNAEETGTLQSSKPGRESGAGRESGGDAVFGGGTGDEDRSGNDIIGKEEIAESLNRFKTLNGKEYRIKRIGLLGSAARDRMNTQIDIDRVVELNKQDLFALIGIKQDLEEQLKRDVPATQVRPLAAVNK